MSKVSIIIPVHNTEQYLEMCIESVLNQIHQNLEIIIIDDGSGKATSEKIRELANQDKRIKVLNNNRRKGVGYSRNIGVKVASGEYLYFLDSDDYIPENTLQILVDNAQHYEIIKGKIKNTFLSNSFVVTFDGLFQPKPFGENRFNLIKSNTARNTLFLKQYILDNDIQFSEDLENYTDLDFIIPAYLNTPSVLFIKEAIYFSRKRNDPINNPSLSQEEPLINIEDYLEQYIKFKKIYTDEIVQDYLDKQLLNFYRKNILNYLKETPKTKKLFLKLSKAMKQVNPSIIANYDKVLRREVGALRKGKRRRYKRIHKQHMFLRNLKKGVRSLRLFYRFLYEQFFTKLPVKKKLIFFESFLGKNYSDSPKYIYEYLIKNQNKYKYVWCFTEKNKKIPGNAIQVKRFSLKYFYYLARAKYWVSNSRLPIYLKKRKENVYLQTWHGTPLKRLVFDMDEVFSADPNYKKNFYDQSRRWDYLSSPNAYSTEIFRRAFKYDKEMLEYGYPRNDILYNKDNKKDIKKLKKKMNLPLDKKVILYAPTWRDDDYFSRGKYNFELELDLNKLQKRLGDEYVIILRMHYFIANKLNIEKFKGFAFDYSTYDDIAELYLVSDILITDYSSVFFDYANLKRPILFFTYDIEKYGEQLRGFYLDMEKDLPGPLLMTSDEVIDSLDNIEEVANNYSEKYEDFYKKFCKWDDGNASKKTVQAVFKK